MKENMDHTTCSELLLDFVAGSLPPDDHRAVEAHLENCEECRAEETALVALRTLDEGAPMLSPLERTHLESAVMAGVSARDDDAVVALEPRRSKAGARIAQALGAAAVVAVIATFGYLAIAGGGEDSDLQTAGDTSSESRDRAGLEEGPELSAPQDGGGADQGGGGEALADDAAETTTAASAGGSFAEPQPTFEVVGAVTSDRLERLGESSLGSVRFAHAYRADDDASGGDLLGHLVEVAAEVSGEDDSKQIEECASRVMESDDTILPTFGLVGKLGDRDVLVLGFAWSPRRSGSLDRYMVWAWERGNCDVAVEYIDGRIKGSG